MLLSSESPIIPRSHDYISYNTNHTTHKTIITENIENIETQNRNTIEHNINAHTPNTKNNSNKSLNCRMYEKAYPEVDDLVVVQVISIVDMGAYCSLLEYNGIEGMILMSELSRRRIRSVNRLIRVGRQEIVAVLRINKEKGYIDLSKKRVSSNDILLIEDRWNKSKAVHSIFRHVAKNSKYGVEQLYEMFGWPMARKYGHAYTGLKYALDHRLLFLDEFTVPVDIVDVLFRNIEKRMRKQIVTFRCVIECTCFTKIGIVGIKKALKVGLNLSTDDFVVKIKLEAAPKYILSISTLKENEGADKVVLVINAIQKEIVKHGGHLVVKSNPKKYTSSQKHSRKLTMLSIDK